MASKPPYFWSLLHDPAHRAEMLEDGWKSVSKVLVFALVLDVVYQVIVLRFVSRARRSSSRSFW